MNPKLIILGLVIFCAISVQSNKFKNFYPRYYGGYHHSGYGCGCDLDCDDHCDSYDHCGSHCGNPYGNPCGNPCDSYDNPCTTVHVSPVVGLLSKMKAKFYSKILDGCDGWGDDCGCGYGHGWKGGKKCKWLHSPYLGKRCRAVNKFC